MDAKVTTPPEFRRGCRFIHAIRSGDAVFQQIMNFLKGDEPQGKKPDDLRVAIAMLLFEAAHRDDTFAPEESAVIERLLTEKFDLTAEQCAQLMASCQERISKTVQLHPYTHEIFERMDPEDRIRFIEMLWEVVYADGVLDPEEDALIRRIGGLIYVDDRDRVLARQRVLARLERQKQ
jgi:uncharacterized tellurite resistance protein B-like protein